MSHPTHSALESFKAKWPRLKCIAQKEEKEKTCSTLQSSLILVKVEDRRN